MPKSKPLQRLRRVPGRGPQNQRHATWTSAQAPAQPRGTGAARRHRRGLEAPARPAGTGVAPRHPVTGAVQRRVEKALTEQHSDIDPNRTTVWDMSNTGLRSSG